MHRRQCKSNGQEYDERYAAYANSFIHAIGGIIAGVISAAYTPSKDQMCNTNAAWRNAFLLASCGYFVQDFFNEIVQTRKDIGMIFHHVFVGLFLLMAVYNHLFTQPLAVLLLNEVSTPFLTIRWNLKRIERTVGWTEDQKRLFFWNGLAFVLTFFVFRILLIPAVWYQTYWAGCLDTATANGSTLATVLVYIGNTNFPILWALNLYWFVLIVKGAMKALRPEKELNETKDEKPATLLLSNNEKPSTGAVLFDSSEAAVQAR